MTTNGLCNFQVPKCTGVKCCCLHDDLISKETSCKLFCPLLPSCLRLWWVLVLGGVQRGCLRSHRAGRRGHPHSAASPRGPPNLPALRVSRRHSSVSSPGSFPPRPRPHRLVPSCKDTCLRFFYLSFSFVYVSCRERRRRGKGISSQERPMVSKNKSKSLA